MNKLEFIKEQKLFVYRDALIIMAAGRLWEDKEEFGQRRKRGLLVENRRHVRLHTSDTL